jgi:glycosyltransferase involved in cell wall biosynthesis
MNKTLSIIIPVWNEEKTLEELVNRVLKAKFPEGIIKEIILVNDGSKDASAEIIDNLARKHKEVKGFHNEKNLGKSQTVKRGISLSTGELVVIQDADFEYDPGEINDLLEFMIKNDLDVVYGNRFGKKNDVIYWQNYIGNRLLSFTSNVFTYPRIRVWIPDMEVCYKLMHGDVAREVGATIVSKSTFGLEPEVTAKLSKYKKKDGKHLKFGIVPISYKPRSIAEGKKMHALKDGAKAFWEIVKFNF